MMEVFFELLLAAMMNRAVFGICLFLIAAVAGFIYFMAPGPEALVQ